jgi:hypothetical protein
MGIVVSIVVGDACWFDRDQLRKKFGLMAASYFLN